MQNQPSNVLSDRIFDPNWVKGPVYRVIREPLLTHQFGLMTKRDFDGLTRELVPNGEDRRLVLALMKVCELCFEVDDIEPKSYLVPDHLKWATKQMRDEWDKWESEAEGRKQRVFGYTRFLPEFVMLQFIGREFGNRHRDKDYARDGFFLQAPDSGACQALVRSNQRERTVTITVRDGTEENRIELVTLVDTKLREIFRPDHVLNSVTKGKTVPPGAAGRPPPRHVQEYLRFMNTLGEESDGVSMKEIHRRARATGYQVGTYDALQKWYTRNT